MTRAFTRLVTSFALILAVAPLADAAVTTVATRDELIAALDAAKPGDEIRLAPGIYHGGLSHAGLHGTAAQPIILAAADSANPPVIDGGQTGLHLSSPEHVELRGLHFIRATGNGLNIDDSSRPDAPARHIVLRNITVRDVGPHGNCDGIKLSGVEDFQLVDCRVERWGDGGSAVDMVGCHRGIVERSRFLGPGGEQANAVQTKGGSSDVVIRRCRIENPGGRGVNIGGSTGLQFFRPADAPFEARNIAVEDCEFLGGAAAVAFVGVDGATVQHNTIYGPAHWAIRILQENTAERFARCRSGKFLNNVVAFRAADVRDVVNIGGNTEPQSFEFAGNQWHCLDRPAETARRVRLPVAEANPALGPAPHFADAEKGDLTIRNSKPGNPGVRGEE